MSVCLSPIFLWKKDFRCKRLESCAEGGACRVGFRFLREELSGGVSPEDLKGERCVLSLFFVFFKMVTFGGFI